MKAIAKKQPAGMTLFELLLVLVLLVVISSMAKPIFDGAFSTLRLKRGSDRVLTAWSELRIQAIQSGEPHQFLFQSESGAYSLKPWQGLQIEQTDSSLIEEPGAEGTVDYGEWQPYEGELPADIEFAEGESLLYESGEQPTVRTLSDAANSNWAEPIVFFPDGSSTEASLLLRNERGLVQRVTLRGLTGIGRASEVITLEESKLKTGR